MKRSPDGARACHPQRYAPPHLTESPVDESFGALSDAIDPVTVNMQKSVEEKPTKSKYGVYSWLSLLPTSSSSTPQLNKINGRQEADDDASFTAIKKLEELNIQGSDDDDDDETESGLSSCSSDPESETETPLSRRKFPTFRKRGPNGAFQYGSQIPRPAFASYTELQQRINDLNRVKEQIALSRSSPESACKVTESHNTVLPSFLPNLNRTSKDILETPAKILEDEGKIRGFLQTPPHQKLPVLDTDDLTCLRGSSPEHVTSDYGSLPGSPYETSASVSSPGSVAGVRAALPNPIKNAASSVDSISTDLNPTLTQEKFSAQKLREMRKKIMDNPDKEKLLLVNEKGNSQLTICLAEMVHKYEDYDEHLICAMIDFCAEKRPKLLWNRNVDGETPLLIACGLRSHPIIARHLTQALVRLGHPFEERYDRDYGNSLLHALALRDDRCYPCMREILQLHSQHPFDGLDINAFNSKGLSPLHIAVLNKNPSCRKIILLIRHGAKPCLPTANSNFGGNAIHLALRKSIDPAHIVEALLSETHIHCANLLTATDPLNETPIQMAVKRVDLSVADLTRLIQTLHRSGAKAISKLSYDTLGPGRRKVVQEIISHYNGQ